MKDINIKTSGKWLWRPLLWSAALAACLLISSCSLVRAYLTPDFSALPHPPLRPPASANLQLQATQQLTLDAASQQQQFISVLQISSEQLQLVALSGLGQRLMDITLVGSDITSSGLLFETDQATANNTSLPFPPQWIISLMQLAYWPLADLQMHWPAPWQVVQQGNQRVLLLEQQLIASVEYSCSGACPRPTTENTLTENTLTTTDHAPNTEEVLLITHHPFKMVFTVKTTQVIHRNRFVQSITQP